MLVRHPSLRDQSRIGVGAPPRRLGNMAMFWPPPGLSRRRVLVVRFIHRDQLVARSRRMRLCGTSLVKQARSKSINSSALNRLFTTMLRVAGFTFSSCGGRLERAAVYLIERCQGGDSVRASTMKMSGRSTLIFEGMPRDIQLQTRDKLPGDFSRPRISQTRPGPPSESSSALSAVICSGVFIGRI